MSSPFEDRLAEARAKEERDERERKARVAAAEEAAAEIRRRKVEAASAARALLPEVHKAVDALRRERELDLEKLEKDGWFSRRHVGWVLKVNGRTFEVPFSGPVTVDGKTLENFVEIGHFERFHSTTDSTNTTSSVSYEPVSVTLDALLTAAATAIVRKHR